MATMQRQTRPRFSTVGLFALALLACAASPATAQFSGGNNPFTQNPDADKGKTVRKPTGLPGARGTQPGVVAPAEKPAADMPPTEALFDAVNRGDTAAARDAIARGAQLDGRNILGLTPLELAIDLGRNDLTFLLLSMRGPTSEPAPAAAPSRTAVAPRAAPRPAERPTARAAAPAPRQREAAADPGTPVPQAGFLGFGGAPTR
jgi:hypothetical protein